MTFRKHYLTLKALLQFFQGKPFTFSRIAALMPSQRKEYIFYSLSRLCNARLLHGRKNINVSLENVTVDFDYDIHKATIEEMHRIEDVSEPYFDILKIIDNPINLYALNKALTFGRILTKSLANDLQDFLASDQYDLYSTIAHSLNMMVEAQIIKKVRRGIFVPGSNYDMAVQVFANILQFFENQWNDYSETKVCESINFCNLSLPKQDSISKIFPKILMLSMFFHKHLYLGLKDFPIIVLDDDKPIGYVPFRDVSEAVLRSTFEHIIDHNLRKNVINSKYYISVEPVDPKITLKDAWTLFIETPSEYKPSKENEKLGYISNEDLRFFPRTP
jgi:hypothetical protein